MTRRVHLFGLLMLLIANLWASSCGAQDESQMKSLLGLYELSSEILGEIPSGATPENAPALVTAMEVVRRVPTHKKLDWQSDMPDWNEAGQHPNDWRGKLVLVRARVRKISANPLPKAAQDQLGVSDYFDCELELSGEQGVTARMLTTRVPQRLLAQDTEAVTTNQRVSATAMIVNLNPPTESAPTESAPTEPGQEQAGQGGPILLVTDSLAWHPDAPDESLGITKSHVWLANQGVDIATLDDVNDDAPLKSEDRASFYQMLAAANRWDANRLATADSHSKDVTELLQNPAAHRAHFFTLRGTARRAVAILVDEPDIQSLYGLRRYYEVEVFVEPEIPIVVKTEQTERQFRSYPVVFCCRALPSGMPRGEDIQEPVEITGAYLKTWAYPSAWLEQQPGGNKQMQVSPLLIGNRPQWLIDKNERAPSVLETYGAWMFVAAIGMIALFVTWSTMGDRRAKRAFRSKFDETSNVDFDQILREQNGESSSHES